MLIVSRAEARSVGLLIASSFRWEPGLGGRGGAGVLGEADGVEN